MSFAAITTPFNRAFFLTFSKKKVILTFLTLLLSSLMITFFEAIGWNSKPWISQSVSFLSFFITTGVLFSLGIFLIKVYREEVRGNAVSLRELLKNSWTLLVGASYISIPIILSYLLLWILLGLFLVVREIPFFGPFFAFAPFLINLTSLLLAGGSILLLFFVAPWIAFCGLNQEDLVADLSERVKKNLFSNIFHFFIAVAPFLLSALFLGGAFFLTEALNSDQGDLLGEMVSHFFLLVPFSFLTSFSVIFFFNFSAEAYVLSKK